MSKRNKKRKPPNSVIESSPRVKCPHCHHILREYKMAQHLEHCGAIKKEPAKIFTVYLPTQDKKRGKIQPRQLPKIRVISGGLPDTNPRRH